MIVRSIAAISGLTLSLAVLTQTALAQRPPANQGPPQMSLERAWAWLMARPGVIIAIGICIVAIAYMIITKRNSRT
jgi:hypothetical protein